MKRLALALWLVACSSDATVHDTRAPSPPLPRVDAVAAGFSTDSLGAIDAFLREQVREGVFPGGVLAVGRRAGIAHLVAVGQYGIDDPRPVESTTIYDLASLTKVVGLTTATYLLLANGQLSRDQSVATIIPEYTGDGREQVRVHHLMTHTSGLPAWVPLYLETPDEAGAVGRVYAEPLTAIPGVQYVYSDLGAILWTQVVQQTAGTTLNAFLRERVFTPIGMYDTHFTPDSGLTNRIAPTEDDPWRGRVLRGEVHDENAFHLGGVSGHAGLFSTAPDLARFAMWMLDQFDGTAPDDGRPRIPRDSIRRYTSRQDGPEGSTRALGWDKRSLDGPSSGGSLLSSASFGHTGFTGTSIWIDPDLDLFVILLTNRVHPTRENRALLPLRGVLADMVVRAVELP